MQAEPGQVPPEGGEAARAFSNALQEEHPSRALSRNLYIRIPVVASVFVHHKAARALQDMNRTRPPYSHSVNFYGAHASAILAPVNPPCVSSDLGPLHAAVASSMGSGATLPGGIAGLPYVSAAALGPQPPGNSPNPSASRVCWFRCVSRWLYLRSHTVFCSSPGVRILLHHCALTSRCCVDPHDAIERRPLRCCCFVL